MMSSCGTFSPSPVFVEQPPHGWQTVQRVGTRFTDGFETLDVIDRPVQVTGVRFEGGEPGIKLLGYQIVPPGRPFASIQRLDGFPPDSSELPTARVEPGDLLTNDPTGQGYELLLGIEVTAEGYWVRRSITISYRIDGRQQEETWPAELIVCTPSFAANESECSP